MKTIVNTSGAPAAIGPYSQATRVDGLVFVSGQLPIDPASGEFVPGGVAEQTDRCLKNVQAILEESGAALSSVVKTTVYLAHITDFSAMNEVYATYFVENPPARAAFEVAALPKGALVEIEAIAEVSR